MWRLTGGEVQARSRRDRMAEGRLQPVLSGWVKTGHPATNPHTKPPSTRAATTSPTVSTRRIMRSCSAVVPIGVLPFQGDTVRFEPRSSLAARYFGSAKPRSQCHHTPEPDRLTARPPRPPRPPLPPFTALCRPLPPPQPSRVADVAPHVSRQIASICASPPLLTREPPLPIIRRPYQPRPLGLPG